MIKNDPENYVTIGMAQEQRRQERLSASPAGVKPKALDWVEEKLTWNATGPIVPVAHTALGRYAITELMIGSPAVLKYWVSLSLGAANIGGFDTLEAAKSAAFADYSARIMSAIEPAGVGVETLQAAAEAGWNACRRQVYLLSEDYIDRTHPLKGPDTTEGNFYRGQYDVAKSFAKAFNAFEARDCDYFQQIDFAALKGDEQ